MSGGSGSYDGGGGGGGSSYAVEDAVDVAYSVRTEHGAGSVRVDWTAPDPTTTTTTSTTTTSSTVPSTTSTTVPSPTTTVPADRGPMAGYGQQLATELTTSVGGTLQINGSGWAPGEPVEVNVYSEPTFLGTVTASSTGTLDASFTLPVSVGAGSHTVVLTGTSITGEPATVRLALTVTGTSTPAASSPATALAFTG